MQDANGDGQWFDEVQEGDVRSGLLASEVLYHGRSAYQEICIFKHRRVGRVLMLDGMYFLTQSLFYELQATLARVFPQVHPYAGALPLYDCGIWTWTLASVDVGPEDVDEQRVERMAAGGKVYDVAAHRAAFVLPTRVRRQLAERFQAQQGDTR